MENRRERVWDWVKHSESLVPCVHNRVRCKYRVLSMSGIMPWRMTWFTCVLYPELDLQGRRMCIRLTANWALHWRTNAMEYSPWEADCHSLSQGIPRLDRLLKKDSALWTWLGIKHLVYWNMRQHSVILDRVTDSVLVGRCGLDSSGSG